MSSRWEAWVQRQNKCGGEHRTIGVGYGVRIESVLNKAGSAVMTGYTFRTSPSC